MSGMSAHEHELLDAPLLDDESDEELDEDIPLDEDGLSDSPMDELDLGVPEDGDASRLKLIGYTHF
jgi:hypothetical protein